MSEPVPSEKPKYGVRVDPVNITPQVLKPSETTNTGNHSPEAGKTNNSPQTVDEEISLLQTANRFFGQRMYYSTLTLNTTIFVFLQTFIVHSNHLIPPENIYIILAGISIPLGLIAWRWVINKDKAQESIELLRKKISPATLDSRLTELISNLKRTAIDNLMLLRSFIILGASITTYMVFMFIPKENITVEALILPNAIYVGALVINTILSTIIMVMNKPAEEPLTEDN